MISPLPRPSRADADAAGDALSPATMSDFLLAASAFMPRIRIGEMVNMRFPASVCRLLSPATLLAGRVALGIPLGL